MLSVKAETLPDNALLRRFVASGDYTDCYVTTVDGAVDLATYVEAFYMTAVFRLERWVLARLARLPSSDEEARQIAHAERDNFAAWRMLERREDQLMMMDVRGRTCSWFMVSTEQATTRLYFGSAVIRGRKTATGRRLGLTFQLLLGFHKLYSRVLLSVARSSVQATSARQA